jgi:hypothetical protein
VGVVVGSAISADGCFEWVVVRSVCFWVANFFCLSVLIMQAAVDLVLLVVLFVFGGYVVAGFV